MRRVLIIGCLIVAASLAAAKLVTAAQAPLPTPQQAPLPAPPPPPPPNAPQPATYPAAELDRILSPIALYPDPLLAQVLAASTYAEQVPDAARWADQHHYLTGAGLTAAISADQLPWDPSVQALLPFPSVLSMMASDLPWTQELGNAFLVQPQDVMDAAQRMRQSAARYGYLQSNAEVIVHTGPYVEILPANPAVIAVPYYDWRVVYGPPRPGFRVGRAIVYGYWVNIGPAFAPWGWGSTRFRWDTHVVIINNAPWDRRWANRAVYVHPYAVPRYQRRADDRHRAVERSERERAAEREGRRSREEHPR